MGDGRNNVANSLLVTGAILGVNIHIVSPKELFPTDEIQGIAKGFAEKSGAKLLITDDLDEGMKGSNIVYTDVWVSMGESNWEERVKLLTPYQVNMEALKKTGTPDNQLIFMHCLPAFHNTETEYGKDLRRSMALPKWKLLMKCSPASMLVNSKKQKTECTPSRQ